jgi:hypothetical protein
MSSKERSDRGWGMAEAQAMRRIPHRPEAAIGDFQRYPGARLLLFCRACSWSKSYHPERVLQRLQDTRAGGHTTTLRDVARRVEWNCPACSRMRWAMQFAWPPKLDRAESRRLANLYRN